MPESLEGLKEKIIESIENEASLRSFFNFSSLVLNYNF